MTTKSGVNAALNSESVTAIIQNTLPALLLAYLDRDYGDFHIEIDKFPAKYIDLKNFTVGMTLFDHEASGMSVQQPATASAKIAGINTTVEFGFYLQLDIGHFDGTFKFDIEGAEAQWGVTWSNDNGHAQVKVVDVSFDKGKVTKTVTSAWYQKWIIELATDIVLDMLNKEVTKVLSGLGPLINSKLMVSYLVNVTDNMFIDLFVMNGPLIQGPYMWAGLNGTVFDAKHPVPSVWKPEEMPDTFDYDVNAYVGAYVPNQIASLFYDETFEVINGNLTTTVLAIVMPELVDKYGLNRVLGLDIGFNTTTTYPQVDFLEDDLRLQGDLWVNFKVNTTQGVWDEAFTILAPVTVDINANLTDAFYLNAQILSADIGTLEVLNQTLKNPIQANLLREILQNIVQIQINNLNEEFANGMSFAKYVPITVSSFISSTIVTVQNGYLNVGVNLNS